MLSGQQETRRGSLAQKVVRSCFFFIFIFLCRHVLKAALQFVLRNLCVETPEQRVMALRLFPKVVQNCHLAVCLTATN